MAKPPERLEAASLIETAIDPRKAAEIMAGEQSSGTFVPVAGETPELKARSAARVERLDFLDEPVSAPSLPSTIAIDPARLKRARVTQGLETALAVDLVRREHELACAAATALAPGSPLCRSHATGGFDSLEIALKGGQVGRPDFFLAVKQAGLNI